MSEEEVIQPRIDKKTWGKFVTVMHRQYSVLPDVGSRSVDDVLQDVVEEASKNRDEGGDGK